MLAVLITLTLALVVYIEATAPRRRPSHRARLFAETRGPVSEARRYYYGS